MFITAGNTVINTDKIVCIYINPKLVLTPPYDLHNTVAEKTAFQIQVSLDGNEYSGFSISLYEDTARDFLRQLEVSVPDDVAPLPNDYEYAEQAYKAECDEEIKTHPEKYMDSVPF